jgi:hypothetical protein
MFVLCLAVWITARHLSGVSTDSKLSYQPSVELRPGPIELGSSSNRVVVRMFTPLLGWALGPPGKGPGVVHDAVLQTADGGRTGVISPRLGLPETQTGLNTSSI